MSSSTLAESSSADYSRASMSSFLSVSTIVDLFLSNASASSFSSWAIRDFSSTSRPAFSPGEGGTSAAALSPFAFFGDFFFGDLSLAIVESSFGMFLFVSV